MAEETCQGPPSYRVSPAQVATPPFPDRPDLYDEVQWGPFSSQEDVEKAYLLWSKQDNALFTTSNWEMRRNPEREDSIWVQDNAAYCLVRTVYNHILENCAEPLTEDQWDAEAQYLLDPETGLKRKWSYEEIFGPGSPLLSNESAAAEAGTGESVPFGTETDGPVTIEIGSDEDVPPEDKSDDPAPLEAEACESDAAPREDSPLPECPEINDSVRKAIPMVINGENILRNASNTTWGRMEDVIIEANRRGIAVPAKKKGLKSKWIRDVVYDHEFKYRWQKDADFREEVYAVVGSPEPEVAVVEGDLPNTNDPSPLATAGDIGDDMLVNEQQSPAKETVPDSEKGPLPREDLSAWGIPRKDDYMLRTSKNNEFSPLDIYTWAITLSPYNPVLWSSRAYLFYQMGYFDLAIGDAYRAQLLCEIVCDPLKRNRQSGLYPRVWDALERHIIQLGKHRDLPNIIELLRKSTGVPYFLPAVRKTVNHIIALSLLALRCWHDYLVTEQYLTQRLAMPDRDAKVIKERWETFHAIARERDRKDKRNCDMEYFYERRYGSTRGRLYPYGSDPIERATETICTRINRDMQDVVEAHGLKKKFDVRSDVLTRQVKVCAAEDIKWGENHLC